VRLFGLGGHFRQLPNALSSNNSCAERVRASERDVRVVAGLVDGCSHSFITSDSIRRLGLDMLPRQPLQSPPYCKLLFLFSDQIALLVRSPQAQLSPLPFAKATWPLRQQAQRQKSGALDVTREGCSSSGASHKRLLGDVSVEGQTVGSTLQHPFVQTPFLHRFSS
jgi:hypothetical protein